VTGRFGIVTARFGVHDRRSGAFLSRRPAVGGAA